MILHKEGYKTIIITLILVLFFGLIINFIFPEQTVYHILYYIFGFLFSLVIVSFFRYPNRTIENNENIILCPADGKVVVIEEVMENEYFKDKRIQVSIFMSPLNVHANWFPVNGKVIYTKYHEGNYFVAFHPKSSSHNERTTVVVAGKNNKEILIRQIAGAVARRIVCYAEENKTVSQGEQLGFIKFGSRVDILLPLDAKIKVKLKQKVCGQKTVIAELS